MAGFLGLGLGLAGRRGGSSPTPPPPTLGTLTLSGTLTNGSSSSGTIIGATAGSTIVSNVTGLTVNSGARTYSFDGTAAAGTVSNGLVETLAGATGSPKSSALTVAANTSPLGYHFFGTGIRQAVKVQTYTPPSSAFNVNSITMSSGNSVPTDIRMFFPTFYNTTTGGAVHEIDTTAVITIAGMSVKINGTGSWIPLTSPGFPIVIDPAVNPAGLWLPPITENVFSANSDFVFRVAFSQAAPAGSPSSWTLPLPETTGVDSSRSATTDLSAYLTNGSALNGSGVVYKPVAVMAKGTDGLPVQLIIGDSIGVGVTASANAAWWNARHEYGYLCLGLDDNVAAKRISYLNLCVAGQGIWSAGTNIQRKLAILTSAVAINNGAPCDEIISEHGTNSINGTITVSQMLAAYVAQAAVFRTALGAPSMPITQLEMIAKPISNDNFQTLAGQVPDATNAIGGVRWNTNAQIALLNAGNQYSFAPWVGGSYDTTTNRDKVKLLSFVTTIAANYAGTATVSINASPTIGDELIIFDTASSAARDVIVSGVSGTGPFTANVVPQGGSGTVPAATSKVVDALHGSGGLHPSPLAHINYYKPTVDAYKQARGWV